MPSTLLSGLLAMTMATTATTSTINRLTRTSSRWLASLRKKVR